jgi:hypothetical protein
VAHAFNPWDAPPPSLATPMYVPPVPNWLWKIPEFVVLDDDKEE